MDFNPSSPLQMHVDINACFATIEQQANPFLRNKPVAVGAYTTGSGCILAASYEAKRLGVKTGMRVKDAKVLCPWIKVISPDPDKYRFVHQEFRKLLQVYSNNIVPKSIDEFTLDFKDMSHVHKNKTMLEIGSEIKKKIKKEIGEYITVSVGISTNRFLAKTAASYRKPDGLFEINKDNFEEVYKSLKLIDLCGIKQRNAARLSTVRIFNVWDFYNADIQKLKLGFHSINGYYWYLRLHGYEIDSAEIPRKSFGNQYALPKPYEKLSDLTPILTKLVEKTSRRLRKKSYVTKGVHLGVAFRDHTYWHKGKKLSSSLFATRDIYREIFNLLLTCPEIKPVRLISVACFNLEKNNFSQMELMCDITKKQNLTKAMDFINTKYGNFTISPARMINNENYVIDRVAFGGMSEI